MVRPSYLIYGVATFLLALTSFTFAGPNVDSSHLDPLTAGFKHPPEQTKPWCYWYWISDNLSEEGITRDLEAMARVGIGEALIGNIFLDRVPAGKIKVLTPEWWGLIEHALREAGRVGVNIGLFNCPGWSQSGGPWITPEQTMRYLAFSETPVTGPVTFKQKLPTPQEHFQDVAVIAYPAPQYDADSLKALSPRVTSEPATQDSGKLVDGDTDTVLTFPKGAGRGSNPFTITFSLAKPFTARSLHIVPGTEPFGADCELQAETGTDGRFTTVKRFKCDRSNMALAVGFMPRAPVTVTLPATTAKRFRLVFTGYYGPSQTPSLAEIELSSAARLESYIEKQLAKMHPTPLPMWDSYLWPGQAEPVTPELVVPAREVRYISKHMAADGVMTWEVPAGRWIIQRIGMTPTGMKNSPASPEGQGLEVDKMNRDLAQVHFNAFIGEVLRRVPAEDRKSFRRVVADSYEMGSQNWTDGFEKTFHETYGYDPFPWLPVLSGRIVGSADRSERFLWDLRRLVADRVAVDYVGGLRDACKPHGLGLWLENYGHWGFPGEFLKYGAESDRIGGEYWVTGDLGSIECRAASSCANIYGKPFVSAEAFTGGLPFQNAPRALKARGDWSFCEGINHFVLHVYIHQPWEDRKPGVNAWFGSEFNRHNTWFEESKTWIDYLRRSCWLLQQGHRVTDVAYFIGEDTPKMTGVQEPELPPGRDFDYINGEVIEQSLTVQNGLLSLAHGPTYRVLVLPELETMRPELLRKIRDLVRAGATVLGTAPSRSPSLENYPQNDRVVRRLAHELWGKADTQAPGERRFGKGLLMWGRDLKAVFKRLDLVPDFEASDACLYTHRRSAEADIYFVANPQGTPLTTTAAFRVGPRAPELWCSKTGRIEHPAIYEVDGDVVRLPLTFGTHGSVFVVFRKPAAPASQRIVSVTHNGKALLGTEVTAPIRGSKGDNPNHFSFALWVKPTDDTTLVTESKRGVVGMAEKRNDVIRAPHGNGFGASGHAGAGLAVGNNGICVFEHAANYFAPPLVFATSLTDWTHVTVVYRDGQAHLYLNGRLAHTGLKSDHIVHSGVRAGISAGFNGQLGPLVPFARALTDGEVLKLSRSMKRPDRAALGRALKVTCQGTHWIAQAAQPGNYVLNLADGNQRRIHINERPSLPDLTGPWRVRFDPDWGAPAQVEFAELQNWTQHDNDGIKHYSGKAVYRQSFELTSAQVAHPQGRLLLDLGDVKDLATVRVNGRDLGTLWLAPWRVDITKAVRTGNNVLEIEVTNVWNNRLVGDLNLPQEQRRTHLQAPTVNKNAPLLPAGLLGPVRLLYSTQITILPGP